MCNKGRLARQISPCLSVMYEFKVYLFACWKLYSILRTFVPGPKNLFANKLFSLFRRNHGVERLWPLLWYVA